MGAVYVVGIVRDRRPTVSVGQMRIKRSEALESFRIFVHGTTLLVSISASFNSNISESSNFAKMPRER